MEINSNISTIEGQNTTKTEKTDKKVKEKGSLRAASAGSLASALSMPVGMLSIKGMQNVAGTLSKEQIKTLNECAEKMLKDAKLSQKGVKIDDVAGVVANFSLLPDSVYAMINPYFAIAEGKNAAFSSKPLINQLTRETVHDANTIIVNKNKLPNALFHEIGHAINYNSSKFWSVIQKMRNPSIAIASFIMLFAAFTTKAEAEDGKELTKAQKTKNFIRNNAGALAGLSMLPVVSEEIMASVRGLQYASKNLTKDLAKKVSKTNIYGAISYIAAAIGLAISAHVAVKVKDSIMEKQKAKAEQQEQQLIDNQEK